MIKSYIDRTAGSKPLVSRTLTIHILGTGLVEYYLLMYFMVKGFTAAVSSV